MSTMSRKKVKWKDEQPDEDTVWFKQPEVEVAKQLADEDEVSEGHEELIERVSCLNHGSPPTLNGSDNLTGSYLL